ncbi:MAG: hypothetical protein RR486_14145 [Clostridium sp.]
MDFICELLTYKYSNLNETPSGYYDDLNIGAQSLKEVGGIK